MDGGTGVIVYKNEMVDEANLHIERRKLAIAEKIQRI